MSKSHILKFFVFLIGGWYGLGRGPKSHLFVQVYHLFGMVLRRDCVSVDEDEVGGVVVETADWRLWRISSLVKNILENFKGWNKFATN